MKLLMKILRLEKRAFPGFWPGCFAALAVTVLLASCTQDPIFAMISREVKPREPRIKGVPSKMAVFNGAVYVGGTSLHHYAGAGDAAAWDEINIPQPPGGIIDLAATNGNLYVLTNADSPALYRWDGNMDGDWVHVPFSNTDFPRLQAIYGETGDAGEPVTGSLFAGARRANVSTNDKQDYAVFCIDDGGPNSLQPVLSGTALLTGAAFDNGSHYFSTGGGGIYRWPGSGDPTNISGGKNVRGMIRIPAGIVLAFCYNGEILKVLPSSVVTLNTNQIGLEFRGPATVWRDNAGTPSLLLAAVTAPDSSYGSTYGYREINLLSGPVAAGNPGVIELREPGTPTTGYPSTMDDNHRYRDTIATKPLNAIFQVPGGIDPEGPLFASVQGTGTMKGDTDGGLWSYRIRTGGWQWNAE
jgi:hypothetical protein